MDKISQKIQQRRLQILVHSYIYYELNDNIVSDSKWSEWAHELVILQDCYPELAKQVIYSKEFEGFEGDTGSHFKYDSYIMGKALQILRLHKYKKLTGE